MARLLALLLLVWTHAYAAHAATADVVKFPSADGKTELVGYLYRPTAAGPRPALVLLHGRSGPYSSLARGEYGAATLSMRHRMWAEFWQARGYIALLVDSFGPRGYASGFPKHSYDERPAAVSEQLVRPLDAYGALAYLRARSDVIPDMIAVQGWSNGGMTVLAAIAADGPALESIKPPGRFRAAIAEYPSCRNPLNAKSYKPYAPLLLLAASEDDEVSPEVCRTFAELMQARGHAVEFVLYEGAQHSYDDPGKTKQSHPPNRAAMQDTLKRAESFFARHLEHGK
jgi:carboxymethylenebutenolidase